MNFKKIKDLPVYTESNNFLGYPTDLEINCETGKINKIFVRNKNLLKNLFQGCLIIDFNQIISISKKEIIVEDNIKKVEDLASNPVK